jgi:hypothetical protein
MRFSLERGFNYLLVNILFSKNTKPASKSGKDPEDYDAKLPIDQCVPACAVVSFFKRQESAIYGDLLRLRQEL